MSSDLLPARSYGGHPGGRPSKCTLQLIEVLAKAISDGLPDRFACDVAGISNDTLVEWRKDPLNDQFSAIVKQAEAERMRKRLLRIEEGLPGWQGSAWVLERKYPEHFARPELQVAIKQDVNVTVNHNVNMVTESDLVRLMSLVREVEAEALPDADHDIDTTNNTE